MTVDRELALAPDAALSLEELDDNDLLRLTRQGDAEAYAALYDRYVHGARRLARHLGQREESDDVVSESFAQVLDLLRRGKGPDRAFRAYLYTTVRHECGRRAKLGKRVMPTDDDTQIDTAVPFGGGDLDDFEKTAIRAAYESLPARWQTVLWHLDVEGRKPGELAEVLGLKPNSVSALVYRARSGLRDAYLQQHVGTTDETLGRSCADVRSNLGGVVRRTATDREQEKVHAHLDSCEACMAVYLDLEEVNREVGLITAPAALAAAVGATGIVAGGGVVVHLFAAVKGAIVAVAAPAAAVTLTGVAVVSVVAPSPAPATDAPVVAVAPSESAPLTSTLVGAAAADLQHEQAVAGAAPEAGAPDAVAVRLPSRSEPRTPAASPSDGPTQPAQPAAPKVDLPATVVVDPVGIEITAGPVGVSTKPVTDLVTQTLPKTSGVVKDLVGLALP